jgi:tellurite resistance protein TerC
MLDWIIFAALIIIFLVIDLFAFGKDSQIPIDKAIKFSIIWILVALAFNVYIFLTYGEEKSLEYLTAYLMEKSLSLDNLFVFLAIFNYFSIPKEYRRKILFYGVLGAIILRLIFIFLGIEIIKTFHFLIYIFGIILIYSGYKIATKKDDDKPKFIETLPQKLPFVNKMVFIYKNDGKTYFGILSIALLSIEISDIIFAIDSIPAVLAITTDPLIVYSSNIFAILGLRSLYFVLEKLMISLKYLKYGLSIMLVFIGIKMLISDFYKIPTIVTFLILLLSIGMSILYSVIKK